MSYIALVDTGHANISSVYYSLNRLSYQTVVTRDPKRLFKAQKVIFPGVGNAKAAMLGLAQFELVEVLKSLTQPTLGICLGMQLLTSSSTEGDVNGLELIPGAVELLQAPGLIVPHMGWNTLTKISEHQLFNNVTENDFFYFVHSYALGQTPYSIASCHHGLEFSAAVAKDNFVGVQFHPERSGKVGALLLKNFLEWNL